MTASTPDSQFWGPVGEDRAEPVLDLAPRAPDVCSGLPAPILDLAVPGLADVRLPASLLDRPGPEPARSRDPSDPAIGPRPTDPDPDRSDPMDLDLVLPEPPPASPLPLIDLRLAPPTATPVDEAQEATVDQSTSSPAVPTHAILGGVGDCRRWYPSRPAGNGGPRPVSDRRGGSAGVSRPWPPWC